MTATPDPSPCRGLAPSGPDCPTASPGASPTVAPVKQTGDGGLGSGVDGVLGTVMDLLPWILVALLLAVVVALLVDRARRRPALVASGAPAPRGPTPAPAPPSAPAPPPRTQAPPQATAGPPQAPAGLPPALVADLLTLADLATTPAVASQVRRMLRSAGIDPIEPAVGDPLDLDGHEVVTTAPAHDPGHHERVARVHRPGWRRGPEVLRPAAVELWVHAPDRPTNPPPTPTLPR